MNTRALWLVLAGIWAVTSLAHNAKEQRAHGAHVHDTAHLQLAVEETQALVSLTIPGMSAVGFEHPPRTREQRDRLEVFFKALTEPNWLILPASAACQLEGSKVSSSGFDEAGEPSDGARNEHAEVRATYRYRCEAGDGWSNVGVKLLALVPDLHKVDVEWITPHGQGGTNLERGQDEVDLSS